jgi:hypothetical protein
MRAILLFVTDMLQHEAASRDVLLAGQCQR